MKPEGILLDFHPNPSALETRRLEEVKSLHDYGLPRIVSCPFTHNIGKLMGYAASSGKFAVHASKQTWNLESYEEYLEELGLPKDGYAMLN